MKIHIPIEVETILNKLNSSHFEAYIVGGCVRDSILGKEPKDWDISTSAQPSDVKRIFEKTVDTGIKHGTVTVVLNGNNFEVTTYRIDGSYSDNRRPDKVEFTSSLQEDLSRRDFTMNAIAYHPSSGLIDFYNGSEDIRNGIIKSVGGPDKRFNEDALRMMRAIRFSAQLGFDVDPEVLKSISFNHSLINNVSNERIRDELTKILVSDHPDRMEQLHDTGLLKHIMPEFDACFNMNQDNPHHIYDVAQHTLKATGSIENTAILRWTMLLHDIGKTLTKTIDNEGIGHFYGHPTQSERIAKIILNRLRFDKKSIDIISKLVKYHDRSVEPNGKAVRRAIHSVGEDIFENLLKVKEADSRAQNPVYLEENLNILKDIRRIYDDIKHNQECLNLNKLAVNGNDLKALGMEPGKKMGQTLNLLMEMALDDPGLNNREDLLRLAEKIRNEQ
ncbi:MAG TPA: CCA tRNA nucleotidyltransferase [Clostridia bacterium]|nr:CCA tRNA nucleotidyltransferase [Clostridia bacterium]